MSQRPAKMCFASATDVAMRDVWRARKVQGLPWGQTGGVSDTSEAAQRAVVLAARCAHVRVRVWRLCFQTGRIALVLKLDTQCLGGKGNEEWCSHWSMRALHMGHTEVCRC